MDREIATTTRGPRTRTACVCPRCDRGLDVAERSPWVDRVQHVLCDECEAGSGTGHEPDPKRECSECGEIGPHVRVIAGIGADPICPICYHEALTDELQRAADTVQRSDAKIIGDLVRALRAVVRTCESMFDAGWRDGLRHAIDIVLDDDARTAYAWREAIRLGPAVSTDSNPPKE